MSLWAHRGANAASVGRRALVLLSLTAGLATVALTEAKADSPSAKVRFKVTLNDSLPTVGLDGRLFVLLSRTNSPEPREQLGSAGVDAPQAFATDVTHFGPRGAAVLGQDWFGFPIPDLGQLPSGDYVVQALLDTGRELRLPNSPGNLYSVPRKLHLGPTQGPEIELQLTERIPAEQLPANTKQTRFIKLPSRLLTEFHHQPMFLRAGVLLPRDYERDPSRRYPLWVRIGGYGTRYEVLEHQMQEGSKFRSLWEDAATPQFILLQLDGAGPYGDPYYVNSANNGPYGDALTQELIPYIEAQFRARGQAEARVLSGSSTGGWVSLALQIFYPDYFNGTWSSCPDPVDFRAYELVNIYEGTNAYLNEFGNERPSERALNGDTVLTMRREVGMENLLGRGNSYVFSGGQWGAWNAVFGPRGQDGLPEALWDPRTGQINHAVAQAWKKYDLRLVLQENWKSLAPKLRGKLHIASGEADQYFLNNAVHLLDEELSHVEPTFSGKIVYGPGKPHGWMNVSLPEMLKQMEEATGGAK